MARVLTFETDDGLLRVAVGDVAVMPSETGEFTTKGFDGSSTISSAVASFSNIFDDIRVYTDALASKLSEIDSKPSEIEVSIGVKLKSQGGLVFIKCGADADMNIKLKWDKTGGSGKSGT
jgi:hypothetical protein